MEYYYRTNLRCTRPELIASGSTFAKTNNSKIIGNNGEEIHFLTNKDILDKDILTLSKEHPEISFSAKTWCDSQNYHRKIHTLIYKNGESKEIDSSPGYVFLGPDVHECDGSLSEEMRNKVSQFLEEIKPHTLFSKSGDSSQYYGDGLQAYFSFIWETEDHRFTAENKDGYMIQIKYESKDKENLERLRLINKSLRDQLNRKDNEGYDDLPF